MVETRDGRSLGEAAEAAAAAGDLDGAARILRELAELQHASLGADHPELAHTLNNLGVVHERLAHVDEAEVCYRRAHAIALTALPPDHPFVETSGRNLREFCAANGRPVELSVAPAPAVAASPAPPAPEVSSLRLSLADVSEQPPLSPRVASPPPAPPRSFGGLVAAVVGIALIVAAVLLARVWSESRAGAGFNTGGAAQPAAGPPPAPEIAAAPAPPPPAPVAPPTDVSTPRPALPAAERPAATAAVGSSSDGAVAKSDRVPAVVEARVCSRLSTAGPRWNCEPVRESAAAGTLFFYTRLKSGSNAVVEHRWYQGERLHRTVELRLSANTGSGYRTFSRQTITPARAGDWRVELRAQDGTLLDEERFTVRPSNP
jgi:hypothetical protein